MFAFSLSSIACAPFTLTATVTSMGGAVLWSYFGSPLYSTAGYITKRAVSAGASYLWRKTTGNVTRYAAASATTYIAGRVISNATRCITGRAPTKLLTGVGRESVVKECVTKDTVGKIGNPSADSLLFNEVKGAESGFVPESNFIGEASNLPLVYFIRSGCITKNEYKIGRTKGAVEKRLAQLQTGSVNKLYVEFVIHTPDASALELCFHKKLTTRRIRSEGEWFSLNRTELNTIEHLVKRWSLPDVQKIEVLMKDYSVYRIIDTENFMIKVKDL